MNARFRQPRWESKKIRDSARDRDCTIKSPWCQNRRETTVWCHSPFQEHGKGMGVKAHDLFGCYGCFECHTYLDLLSKQEGVHNDERRLAFYRAMCESLLVIVTEGILK
jgi:hypothetical protein